MAKFYEDPLSLTFGALSDPTRRTIVSLLRKHPGWSVGEVADHLPLQLPGITKHLDVLERAELLERDKIGRVVSLHLTPRPLKQAMQWMAQYESFWTGSLDKLQRHLERGR